MAGKKISELPALAGSLAATDLFEVSDHGGGAAYSSKSVSAATIAASVYGLTTGFTEGSIVFIDGSGLIAQDNANFFWDDSNNRLGIGVDDPDSTLEVWSASSQQKWSYSDLSFATMFVDADSHTTFATGEDGDLTLDIAGDIELNAMTNIIFKSAAVTMGQMSLVGSVTVTGGQIATNRKLAITSTTDGDFDGDVVYFGTGTTAVGKMYYFDGTDWLATDANTAASAAAKQLLGIGLGTTPATHGMLLRGMVTLDHDPGAIGDVLYISGTAGEATSTAPSTSGDTVRIVGYCMDSTNGQIWFNPSSEYILLA